MPITNLTLNPEDRPLPCPFCGGSNLELSNTHTACYSVECNDCGAQITGENLTGNYASEKIPLTRHIKAKSSALLAWNRRAPAAPAPAERVAAKPT